MQGAWGGLFDCLEETNIYPYNTDDPDDNSVILNLDIQRGSQIIWAQIMSQCFSNSNNNTNGNGFWFKHEETYSSVASMTAVTDGIDLEFIVQDITECTDSSFEEYGCDSWDLGHKPN